MELERGVKLSFLVLLVTYPLAALLSGFSGQSLRIFTDVALLVWAVPLTLWIQRKVIYHESDFRWGHLVGGVIGLLCFQAIAAIIYMSSEFSYPFGSDLIRIIGAEIGIVIFFVCGMLGPRVSLFARVEKRIWGNLIEQAREKSRVY